MEERICSICAKYRLVVCNGVCRSCITLNTIKYTSKEKMMPTEVEELNVKAFAFKNIGKRIRMYTLPKKPTGKITGYGWSDLIKLKMDDGNTTYAYLSSIELIDEASAPKSDYPHICPRCGGPALFLATSVDCSAKCGR